MTTESINKTNFKGKRKTHLNGNIEQHVTYTLFPGDGDKFASTKYNI